MASGSIGLDGATSILFIGNSYTFGRVDPVMSYNAANVRDLTAPVPGSTFANTTGSNPYEPHPWGGVPGIFKQFTADVGLTYDVALSTRNAASLQGHYLNSNPAGWDLRGNLASQAWDTVVLQDNSTQALPSGAGSVTFQPGSATATLTLTPVADTKVEQDETIGLKLAAGTGYRVGTSSTLTGTILNDDPTGPAVNPALPTVTLSADPSAVLEDSGGRLVYTFTRTGPTTDPLIITFATARDGSTAPSVATGNDFQSQGGSIYKWESGGAATAGSVSFTSNTGSVTIAAGATTATLTLVPQADATVENDESIRFTLSSNAAYNVGTPGPVSVTILNDDFPAGTDTTLPNITASLQTAALYEDGGGSFVYTFTRTGSLGSALTVNFGVTGTATLPGNDFTVAGATSFATGGAADPDLASFQTYAVKLAQYAKTGAADGSVPANANANPASDIYLYETWARPNLVTGARVATTDPVTGAITTTGTSAAEYYGSLEAMTADLRAAYEGLAAANPIFRGVAPVGAAFLAAVQNGTAIRDPYTTPAGTDGKVDLWWDDNLHASKYGSYLSALTLFGTITGLDPRSLGAGEKAAADLGIDPAVAAALQNVAAATLGLSLQAHWTAPGQVTSLTGSAHGLLASAGAFSFSDTDRADVHTVGVTPETSGAFGTLTATLHSDTTGDGSGGAVNWLYTVDDAAVRFLGAGQTRVERFLVTVSDQTGGAAQREIAVTINGLNDAPVVTGVTGMAIEGGARVTLDALAGASDPDQGTVLSVVGLPSALPPGVSYDAATHSFTLDPSSPAFHALSPAEKQSVTIAYSVSDGIADPVAASVTFAVAVDTVAPSLTLAGVSGATNRASGHVLSGSLGPEDAGLAVTIRDGTQLLGSTVSDAQGRFSLAFADDKGGPVHTYALTATATDAAGNVGISDIFAYTIDYTPNRPLFGTVAYDASSHVGGVYALYEGLLDRAPDADGFQQWVQALDRGASLQAVTQAFLDGPEAQGHFGASANADFVEQLYATVLHRPSDAAGKTGWVAALDQGAARAQVADAFVFSGEHLGPLSSSYAAGVYLPDTGSAEVARLYYGLLGRAPDAAGLGTWGAAVDGGATIASIAQAFLDSGEYAALHGSQTDRQFVETLYQSALGRPAEASGEEVWLTTLAQGGSRAQVAIGIAEGTEARAHWLDHIEQGWHLA